MFYLCREMQNYVELKEQLPVRPRHLVGAQVKEQLMIQDSSSQQKDALKCVTSSLRILAAVLTVSEAGQSLAAASCR